MELKLHMTNHVYFCYTLLIVPYGIETREWIYLVWGYFKLLIVPYGIETHTYLCFRSESVLLIVPYGIETPFRHSSLCGPVSFNRTLWN